MSIVKKQKPKTEKKPKTKNTDKREPSAEKPDGSLLSVSGLTSEECYQQESGELISFFTDVTFKLMQGEAWGISAAKAIEAEVLCEILGSMRPYLSGSAKLTSYGSMKKKKRMVEDIFYIDSHLMLFDNMNVLELMMFSTIRLRSGKDPAYEQEQLLDMIEDFGLSYIALTPVSDLYDSEKILITLILAALSKSRIIILNALHYSFSQSETEVLKKITDFIKRQKKSLIMATMQAKLIGICCENTIFLKKGAPAYCGDTKMLIEHLDKVKFALRTDEPDNTAAAVERLLPGWRTQIVSDYVYLANYSGRELSQKQFFELLADSGINYDAIKINRGRMENSFSELIREDDI